MAVLASGLITFLFRRIILTKQKRQEIMEAVAVGAGEAERFSDTLDKTTYYYAVRLEDGKILRLARTIDSIYNRCCKCCR